METIPFALTPEMHHALDVSGGTPIQLEDSLTQQRYLLVEQPIEVTLDEDYIRQGLQVARDEFNRGEYAPWDIEATIAEAQRRHESGQ